MTHKLYRKENIMSNEKEIEISKSFEERMKDRVREGIGDLITDDDLRPLIIAGIKDVFTERKRRANHSGYQSGTEDSIIESVVKDNDELREVIKEEVVKWMQVNDDFIKNTLDTYVKDNVVNTFNAVINDMMASTFQNFKFGLQNDLQQMFNGQIQQY